MTGQVIPHTSWELERLGKFTASRISELLAEAHSRDAGSKPVLSGKAMSYIYEKAAEITTGTIRHMDLFPIDWTSHYEAEAVDLLRSVWPQLTYFRESAPKYFALTDFSGGSPDAVDFTERTVFEIRCPENPADHIACTRIDSDEMLQKTDCKSYYQLQMNMLAVSRYLKCDFFLMRGALVSYYPHMQDDFHKLHRVDVYPDWDFFKKIYRVLEVAEGQLAGIISKLTVLDLE